ncbi:MAG: hypothetical protein JXJ30_06655 [Halothiobacillaceae bacterium]|nr:hypothetical protein [Halothiobacillaceae bacterium]
MTNGNRRQKAILLGLAVIFLLPLAASWTLYTVRPFDNPGGLQNGVLLDPVERVPVSTLTTLDGKPVDSAVFRGKWTLLYHVSANQDTVGCDADCREMVDTLSRVRIAQNEGMRAVQRVLLEPAGSAQAATFDDDLKVFESHDWPLAQGAVYLVDRQGYLALRYDPGFDPQGLLDDLDRLLRLAGEG